MRVVTHLHSNWSYDGVWSLERLASMFARLRVPVLLMAEHDNGFNDARWKAYRRACAEVSSNRILVVPGMEYSSVDNSVHVLVWGSDEFFGQGLETSELLGRVADEGAVAVFAHPGRRDAWRRWEPHWADVLLGIEAVNRRYDGPAANAHALKLLEDHPNLIPFASLDFHSRWHLFPLAMNVEVGAAVTAEHVVATLRAGRCRPEILFVTGDHFLKGRPLRIVSTVDRLRRPVTRSLWRWLHP